MTDRRAPDPAQRDAALATANRHRVARGHLKDRVEAGDTHLLADLVACPPDPVRSMYVRDLLMTQHRWGRRRTLDAMGTVPMTERQTLAGMTARQRTALVAHLAGVVDAPGVRHVLAVDVRPGDRIVLAFAILDRPHPLDVPIQVVERREHPTAVRYVYGLKNWPRPGCLQRSGWHRAGTLLPIHNPTTETTT